MKFLNELFNFNLIKTNKSDNRTLILEEQFLSSYRALEQSRKINIFATIFFITVGLIGNSLILIVFGRRRFRKNSSNVFLLCLAFNDSLFLLLHFFENTIRAFDYIYLIGHPLDTSSSRFLFKFVNFLNITDKYEFTCRTINYLRHVLRFISAYIIVAFTFQRLILVQSPLSTKLKSKKSAWITVFIIGLVSCLINFWVPFTFEVKHDYDSEYCGIRSELRAEYFFITNAYICIIIIIPVISIFISNLIIMYKTKLADKKRKTFQKKEFQNSAAFALLSMTLSSPAIDTMGANTFDRKLNSHVEIRKHALMINRFSFKFKPLYRNSDHQADMAKVKNINKITTILILISFSYAILNVPYLITWCLFFNEFAINYEYHNPTVQNYLFAAFQISEIFYVLNYSLHFYFYCMTGTKFLSQLKYSSNIATYIYIIKLILFTSTIFFFFLFSF